MDVHAIFGIYVCNTVPDLFYDLLFKSIKLCTKDGYKKELSKNDFYYFYELMESGKMEYNDTWFFEVVPSGLINYNGPNIFDKKYNIKDFIKKLRPYKNNEIHLVTINKEFYLYYFSDKFIICPNQIDSKTFDPEIYDKSKYTRFEAFYYFLLEKKIIYEDFIVATIDDKN